MEEKRKERRLELESQIILKKLNGSDTQEDKVNISIRDVSKSGMGFRCNEPLVIGSVYECLITIWTKEVIHAFVEIVRIVKKEDAFEYGGIFIGMPEMDMKRIEIYEQFDRAQSEA